MYLAGQVTSPIGQSQPQNLGQDLIVENKVVRVSLERQTLEQVAGKSAVAGVVFGKLGAEQEVLAQGQKTIGHKLPDRHSTAKRASAENS